MPPAAKRTSSRPALRSALQSEVRRADRRLPGPRILLTREASRRLDAACTAGFAIPSLLLMEHASLHIAEVLIHTLRRCPASILILAGPGNNGGDGLACARHIHTSHTAPVSVLVFAAPDRLSADAAANLAMARRLRIPIRTARSAAAVRTAAASLSGPLLILDALLGTGLSRPASGPILSAIRAANQLRESRANTATLAVDVPSGLDADTGLPPPGGESIRADATVTMAGLKPGLCRSPCTGPVAILPIGAPPALLRRLGKPIPRC